MTATTTPTTNEKRKRLSVDLEAYPDIKRMLARAEKAHQGVPTTVHVINALRKHLTDLGFAGKKDLAA